MAKIIVCFLYIFMAEIHTLCDIRIYGLPVGKTGTSLSTAEVLAYMVQYGYLEDRSSKSNIHLNTPSPYNNLITGNPNNQGGAAQPGGRTNVPSKSSLGFDSSSTTNKTTGPELDRVGQFSDREIETALYDFQSYMNIPQTGKLDAQTSESMKQPRCGMKDKWPHLPWTPLRSDGRRRRRYVVQGSSWSGNTITYTIGKPTRKLTFQEQNSTIFKAISIWSGVVPVTFEWTDNIKSANIVIKFEKGKHGDNQNFDGPGYVLGHAFYPSEQQWGGEIHFDDDENWVTGDDQGTVNGKESLLLVALHELGHALGLQHSSTKTAVMYPLYASPNMPIDKKVMRKTILDPDDVAGIQSVYGKCGPRLDSFFSWMGDGKTYAFRGKYVWKINDVAKETYAGYPKLISSVWKGIPDNIDESFLWGYNWKTYFFKGKYYYRFHDSFGKVDDYYPKLISEGWPGIPDNIDAAFTWSNYVSYFFKGNLCYRFDNTNNRVYQGYPKNISEVWPGIPDKIDTVFRYYWDGAAYFFSGFEYWKLDDKTSTVKGPLKTANGWKNICMV